MGCDLQQKHVSSRMPNNHSALLLENTIRCHQLAVPWKSTRVENRVTIPNVQYLQFPKTANTATCFKNTHPPNNRHKKGEKAAESLRPFPRCPRYNITASKQTWRTPCSAAIDWLQRNLGKPRLLGGAERNSKRSGGAEMSP